jgi:hypothetical protein
LLLFVVGELQADIGPEQAHEHVAVPEGAKVAGCLRMGGG